MSLHHTQDAICPLCQDKRKDAHPILQEWWDKIKIQFPDAHLSWTYRDKENQELFFREGKTRVHFPDSAHNKMPAEAMDIFQIRPDKVAAWPENWFRDIAQWLANHGAPIQWGGVWKTLGDGDHFQLKHEALAQSPKTEG